MKEKEEMDKTIEEYMEETKEEPKLEDIQIPVCDLCPFDGLWTIIILSLLFWQPSKPEKVINIYMGDDK